MMANLVEEKEKLNDPQERDELDADATELMANLLEVQDQLNGPQERDEFDGEATELMANLLEEQDQLNGAPQEIGELAVEATERGQRPWGGPTHKRIFKVLCLAVLVVCITAGAVTPSGQPASVVDTRAKCAQQADLAQKWFKVAEGAAKVSFLANQLASCDAISPGFGATKILQLVLGSALEPCEQFLQEWKKKTNQYPTISDIAFTSGKIGLDAVSALCTEADKVMLLENQFESTVKTLFQSIPQEKPFALWPTAPPKINIDNSQPVRLTQHVQSLFFLDRDVAHIMIISPTTSPTPTVTFIDNDGYVLLILQQTTYLLESHNYVVFTPKHDVSIVRVHVSGYATDFYVSTAHAQPTAKSPLVTIMKY